jgi:hypothetical protein
LDEERVQLAASQTISAVAERVVRRRATHFAWAAWLSLAGVLFGTSLGCHQKQSGDNAIHHLQHVDFNQDVQPILASNCFSCHGPDPEMRKAGLRLDLEESAFRKRPGHPDAIVPGHPENN